MLLEVTLLLYIRNKKKKISDFLEQEATFFCIELFYV